MKILITGASKGIGLQIAKELAERGYELVLHCNSTEKALLDFVDENKNKNHIVKADLSTVVGAVDLFNQTCKAIGFPDSIINNAGVADSSPIEKDIKEWSADFDKTISVNLKSPAIICKEFILKKRSSDTFTIEVYEQQTKNLDQIEGSVDEIAEQMEGILDK